MATSHVQILVEFTKKLPGIFYMYILFWYTVQYSYDIEKVRSVGCKVGIISHLI